MINDTKRYHRHDHAGAGIRASFQDLVANEFWNGSAWEAHVDGNMPTYGFQCTENGTSKTYWIDVLAVGITDARHLAVIFNDTGVPSAGIAPPLTPAAVVIADQEFYWSGATILEPISAAPAGLTAEQIWAELLADITTPDSIGEFVIAQLTAQVNAAVVKAQALAAIAEAPDFTGQTTMLDAIDVILAAVAGRLTGANTGVETFRGRNDATQFISTIDGSGNRVIDYGVEGP